MENLDKQIKKQSINFGLVLGVISLTLSILTYYLIINSTSSMVFIIAGPIILSFIIPIVLVVLLCLDFRKKIGGFWVFKQAVTGFFIMFLIAFAIKTVGNDLIFAKFIEPNMFQKTQSAMMEATVSMLEKSGAEQTVIDDKKQEIEKQLNEQKTIGTGKIILDYGISILFIFVLALIFGAIFKKNPILIADEEN